MKPIGISFSHKLLLVTGMMFLLDTISKGTQVAPALNLSSGAVLEHYQVWRLFSYPFAGQSVGEVLTFMSVMFFAGDKVETIFPRYKFALLLLMLTLLQGLGFMLVAPYDPNALAGTSLLSFFTLGMYFSMFSQRVAEVFGGYRVPVPLFAGVLATMGLLFSGAYLLTNESYLFYRQFSQSILGACLGIGLSWSHIRSGRKKRAVITSAVSTIQSTQPDEQFETVTSNTASKMTSSITPVFSEYSEEDYTNEQQLNLILDKILETGYDSLSASERHFLEKYSEHLRE